jgi:hypothetical protein
MYKSFIQGDKTLMNFLENKTRTNFPYEQLRQFNMVAPSNDTMV